MQFIHSNVKGEEGNLINNGHSVVSIEEEERTVQPSNFVIFQQLNAAANLKDNIAILRGSNLDGIYQVLQLHFHWGSDNTKGKMYPGYLKQLKTVKPLNK